MFNKKTLLKCYECLFIHYTILLNIWPIVKMLRILFKPNNWLLKSKWKKVYLFVEVYLISSKSMVKNHLICTQNMDENLHISYTLDEQKNVLISCAKPEEKYLQSMYKIGRKITSIHVQNWKKNYLYSCTKLEERSPHFMSKTGKNITSIHVETWKKSSFIWRTKLEETHSRIKSLMLLLIMLVIRLPT